MCYLAIGLLVLGFVWCVAFVVSWLFVLLLVASCSSFMIVFGCFLFRWFVINSVVYFVGIDIC